MTPFIPSKTVIHTHQTSNDLVQEAPLNSVFPGSLIGAALPFRSRASAGLSMIVFQQASDFTSAQFSHIANSE